MVGGSFSILSIGRGSHSELQVASWDWTYVEKRKVETGVDRTKGNSPFTAKCGR